MMKSFSRRDFLRFSSALGGASVVHSLGLMPALAADTSGYKALVCIRLNGGMDNFDTVIPYDTPSYDQLRGARRGFINGRADRRRSALLPLDLVNQADFGDRRFAFPKELAPLRTLFHDRKMAILGNVGPLVAPMTGSDYRSGRVPRPPFLFAHREQNAIWATLNKVQDRFGWGGRFMDEVTRSSGLSASPDFTLMRAGNDLGFLSGETGSAYGIGARQRAGYSAYNVRIPILNRAQYSDEARAEIFRHMANRDLQSENFYEHDLIQRRKRPIGLGNRYSEAGDAVQPVELQFPQTRFGQQMLAVAEAINRRHALGVSRQILYATHDGYDTHNNQVERLTTLHDDFAQTLSTFYAALEQMGVANDVVVFTISDFGRTLSVSGGGSTAGSEHGWGGHAFIFGGAVDGGKIYGDIPPSVFRHDRDAGLGRLIPSTSVEQYAATLGRWFGLGGAELAAALPRLHRFDTPPQFL